MKHEKKIALAQAMSSLISELTDEEKQRALGFLEGLLARKDVTRQEFIEKLKQTDAISRVS